MARIVLQPCRILWNTFVPTGDSPLDLDLPQLVAKLSPPLDPGGLTKIRSLQVGAFVGLSRTAKGVLNFVLLNPDRLGNFEWVVRKDPTFEDRVIEVYRVELATWDGSITEF